MAENDWEDVDNKQVDSQREWEDISNDEQKIKEDIAKSPIHQLGYKLFEEILKIPGAREYYEKTIPQGETPIRPGEEPQPSTIPAQLGAATGKVLPDIAMATPFLRTAGLIPAIGKSALATGITGLGAYGATKGAVTEGAKGIIPGAISGAESGLAYGVGGRIGATLIPKAIPAAERIGTSLGMGAISSMLQQNENEKTADFMFGAGLGALSPVPRYDVKSGVASKLHFEGIGERLNKIPRETTKIILNSGWDEVKRVGKMREVTQDPITGANQVKNAANISKDYIREGIQEARKINSDLYDKAEQIDTKLEPNEVKEIMSNIKNIVSSRIKDPSSPFHDTFDKAMANLMGMRVQGVKQLQGKFTTDEVVDYLERSGFENKVTLQTLNNIKKTMWDELKSGSWKNPRKMTNEESTAKQIGDYLSDYIGNKNEGIKLADTEWRKMKSVEDDIYDLSSKDLSQNWKRFEPSLKNEYENSVNKIDSYFSSKGLGKYQIKDMLEKYHAYNEWTNPNLGSIRETLLLRSAIGGGVGALLGGKPGAVLGSYAVYKYGRPESYVPFLEKVKPKTKSGNIDMEKTHHITTVAEIAKALMGGE